MIWLSQISLPTPWAIALLAIAILGLASTPVYQYITKRREISLPWGNSSQHQRLSRLGRDLLRANTLDAILKLVRQDIQNALEPAAIYIFLPDTYSETYTAAAEENGKPPTDLRFPINCSLVAAVRQERNPLRAEGVQFIQQLTHSDRSRLALLDVQVIAPMHGSEQLVGWIALRTNESARPLLEKALNYLGALCELAASAIERAQKIAHLDRRVREMNILSRLAQGVNVTPAFDDMLELIYAQASQAIPCDDFYITLRDQDTQSTYHALCVEENERLSAKENQPLPTDTSLIHEIIRNQHALQTEDYHRECLERQVKPDNQWIYAWMSVPLNAGAETIGAISLGTRDPLLTYHPEQLNLLQAIADQAAGAIVKTRLIHETEQRAHQLTILNEISRSLTSTLEIKPLLHQILQSATEILNCEAGSLFMIDEQTDELVFEVTTGPVAAHLIGQRLPPGTGIAGKAVEQGSAIIANEARSSSNWFEAPDRQTGFVTRDILVVPLQVKEKIIGVIEIINKKDSSPFTIKDQELLSTFASQAAVAIENARLYTQTDQALSARVEELSVMQRIDRELNASLELERVLRITLDWAMRQSRAHAGLIGLVEPGEVAQQWKIEIMAMEGYANVGLADESSVRSRLCKSLSQMPAVQQALQLMQPCRSHTDSSLVEQRSSTATNSPPDDDVTDLPSDRRWTFQALLAQGQDQVVIPLHRRNEPIGILLLESTERDTFKPENIAFLSRLSDHAAIAISNAQYYSDLQAANVAKSEFISLVSHELKTPMTSIRGYTDLLAKGTVGPVNDIQMNFLNTIRSNVNRMSTLVSDLSDISRIEAGRMRLEFGRVAIADVVGEVLLSVQSQIEEKAQSLQVEIPTEIPPVWGDYNRLVQILTNLISNANKYTPDGGKIRISAQQTANRWNPEGAPEVVLIEVADTGYGISAEDQHRIFQKFFRSEDPNIRQSPGTGLGLSIVRHLVEMQGGNIWFESEAGKGTSFYFTIPISSAGAT